MKIILRIIGKELHAALISQEAELEAAFASLSRSRDFSSWEILQLPEKFSIEDLTHKADTPSVVIMMAEDLKILERIQLLARKTLARMRNAGAGQLLLAPIILISKDRVFNEETFELPEVVSDWTFYPVQMDELVRRIFMALKRKNLLRPRLKYGALKLLPESRQMSFEGKTIQLAPSESALAELFLSQAGTVIPLNQLVALFKSAGRSTEGSNIRVTIFQLRLKLETLTNFQMTVSSVYGQGYCLRQKLELVPPNSCPPGVSMERTDYSKAEGSHCHASDQAGRSC